MCRDVLFGEVRSIEVVVRGPGCGGDSAKGNDGNIGDDASSTWWGMASAGWEYIVIEMVSSGQTGAGSESKKSEPTSFACSAPSPATACQS
jgi:hypothetical protein